MASMNCVRLVRICWLCIFLPLIFFLNGCSTVPQQTATNKDLEKYRKVYLVKSKRDERDLAAGVLSRLQRAGFDANTTDDKSLKKMAAAKEPTLVCRFYSISTWDYNRTWYCFETAEIHFYDFDSGKQIFEVNYFHPNSMLPENTELNRMFIQIRDNFFPGQPNPFRDKPRGPFGPPYQEFQHDL
jgi:hypothetical protein